MSINKENIFKIILLLPAVVLCMLTFIRLFFGIGMSDEAFYIAMPKSFTEGMIPFVTNWDSQQTSAFFLVPFIFLYRLITGGTEGLFIYTRIICFILMLFVGTVGYFSISKYTNKIVSVYISIILVTYAPFSLYNIGYNALCYSFLLLGLFLILNAFSIKEEEKYKRKKLLLFLAGISHALMAFFYPSMIIICILMGLVLVPRVIYVDSGYKSIIKFVKYYILGGLSMASIVFIMILAITGGVNNLRESIEGIFANSWYKSSGINFEIISEMPNYVYGTLKFQHLELLIYVIIIIFYIFKLIKDRFPLLYIILGLAPIVALAYQVVILLPRLFPTYIAILYSSLTGGVLPVGLLMLTKKHKNLFIKLFTLMYIPSFIAYLIICNTSAGTYVQASWVMIPGTILSAIFLVLLMEEQFEIYQSKKGKKHSINIVLIIQIIICMLFSISHVFLHYRVVYNEFEIRELNSKIEYGVYKGIRTAEIRKNFVENTERALKERQKEGKTVMAMENVSFAYLMLDMKPSVSTLWAPSFICIGIKDCEQILKYYSDENRRPDYIFFLYPDKYSYGEDPEYELHNFIRENYNIVEHHEYDDRYEIPEFFVYQKK